MEFKEKDISELESLLLGLKKDGTKFFVWNCCNDSIVKAEVILRSYNKSRRQISCWPIEGSAYYLQEMVTGLGKLNFYIPEKSMYFVSDLKLIDDELVISWPEKLYFNDRREIPRATDFESVVEIEFEFENKRYKRNCFDIGTGGLSFTLSPSESYTFKKSDMIPFINLKINNELIEISAEVHSIDKIDPKINKNYAYKTTRISLRFIGPDPEAFNKISKLVKSHNIDS